jgi:hypothetical protein
MRSDRVATPFHAGENFGGGGELWQVKQPDTEGARRGQHLTAGHFALGHPVNELNAFHAFSSFFQWPFATFNNLTAAWPCGAPV